MISYPNYFEILLKSYNLISPFELVSNNLNAFFIYSIGSLFKILIFIKSKKSLNKITPFLFLSNYKNSFLTYYLLIYYPNDFIAKVNFL